MGMKHFVEFAVCVSHIANMAERKRTAKLISDVCSHFNSDFDSDKFFRACKIETQ